MLRHYKAIAAVITLLAAATPRLDAQIDSATTVAEFEDYLDTCTTSATAPWRIPLCGPVLGVHFASGFAIATDSPPIGRFSRVGRLWVGRAPEGFGVANTAMEIAGRRYATVNLPISGDLFLRTRLLAHEEFHRIQPDLGLVGADHVNPHLDEPEGRILLRLELRALASALSLDGAAADSALRDAMLFRVARHARYPGADTLEAALEIQEGIAEYTGTVVALRRTGGGPGPMLSSMEAFEDRPTYVRSLGYGTGPALGLLLDRHAPGWQRGDLSRGMASILVDAIGFVPPRDLDAAVELASRRHGGLAIRYEEEQRGRRLSIAREQYTARLVTGPVLLLDGAPDLFRSFNPNTLLPLGEHGTVYPTGTFTASWGKLTVTDHGALLSPSNLRVRVGLSREIDSSMRRVEGNGWVLELEDGWQPVPAERRGDWTVRRMN